MTNSLSFVRVLRLLPFLLIAAPALAAPTPASGFTINWADSGTVSASWTDQSNNELGFIVGFRFGTAGNFSFYDHVGANVTTFSATPDSWSGCRSMQWAVFAYNGSLQAPDAMVSNIVTLVSPPHMSSASQVSGALGQNLTYTLTTTCASPVWSVPSLPPGLSFTAATGVISGIPTQAGRFNVSLTITSGGRTVTNKLRIYIFRPVPAPVAPVNNTPLTDRTLRRNATASVTDLAAHFSDPDVPEITNANSATRLVFNTGTIDFVYFPGAAPLNVANFKSYVTSGALVNTFIHRSVPGFVLQGGGYRAEAGAPRLLRQPAVVNEPEITNDRGTVAMAKSEGDPDSATSEFFISLANNGASLSDPLSLNVQNEGFTVMARVAGNGMAVADAIAALPVRNYTSTNGVLTHCPVTNPPPAAYSVDSLVKLLSAGPVAPLSYGVQSSAPSVCGVSVNGAQLSLTPLAAGTATITVTATDLDNQSLVRTFTVTVEERLSDWLVAQNFPNAGDATAGADPDKDNGQNIMEFGLMTDPKASSPVPAPQAGVASVNSSSYLTLAFPVRKFAGPGFLYTVEAAGELTGPWTDVWTSAQGFGHVQVVSATDLPDRTSLTIRDTSAISPGVKRFVRLRVTDTP